MGSLLLLAATGLPLPGYSVGPGPTFAVDDFIEAGSAQTFPPAGELLVGTVALHPLSPVRAVQAWLDGDIDAIPADGVVDDDRRSEDMSRSRRSALDVARTRLADILDDDPASLGDIEIDDGGVDGNSAGLAFTLGILDLLTPGELTGGRRIGVTGTIGPDGEVGPVGSVAYKAIAMRQRGAELFLVPAGQGAQAAAEAGGTMTVVEVSSLDEALAALAERGGSALQGAQGP